MADESDMNSGGGKRWLYGVNVALLIIVALVILGFFFYITNGHYARKDMTLSGMYSLSGETKNLLKQIGDKNQNYTVISLFGDDESGQTAMDLLDEYARTSGHVKVIDGSSMAREDVEKPIRKLYASELKPYEDTVSQFDGLAEEVGKFFKSEGDNFGALAQKPGLTNEEKAEAMQVRGLLNNAVQEQIATVRKEVERATGAVNPNWRATTETVKTVTDGFTKQLTTFAEPEKLKGQLSPATVAYFTSANARYKSMLAKVIDYKAKLDALQPLKVQDIVDSLQADSIVVLGPTTAKVISPDDIFKRTSEDAAPSFVGEQALSSALLSMVRPEKVKVVFVTASPTHLTTGPMSEIADILRQDNFDVSDWSPPSPPGMDQTPPDLTPPPQGKGVIWIVFPPTTPNEQQMMMGMGPPNPQPVIDAAKKHLDAGGSAMFLAEGVSGMPMNGTDYAYDSLTKDFGVDVEPKFTLIHAIDRQNPETGATDQQPIPMIDITRYSNHEITRTLDSLKSDFRPLGGSSAFSGMPTVVKLADKLPSDIQAQVIITTPSGGDYWGSSSMAMGATKFNKDSDLAAPVPLAVAAIKGTGDKQQRVVVIGHTLFASNPFLDYSDSVVQVGGHLVPVQAFPGNSELFRNSVLWLAGYENMIAVSSKANVAQRIHGLSEGTLKAIEWGVLFTGAPLGVLVIGGIVWYLRKR